MSTKKFNCEWDQCTFATDRNSDFVIHMRRHLGEKPFVCPVPGCNFAGVSASALDVHSRPHTNRRPYPCPEPNCNYAATQYNALQAHMVTHTKERKYPCTHPDCNYAATTAGALTVHMRIHSKERPFTCDYPGCSYTAAQYAAMKGHKLMHANSRPYKCTYPNCTYAANCASHVKTHFKAIHTPEGQQRQKTQEERIAKVLQEHGIDFKREHSVDFRCIGAGTCARIDFVLQLGNCIVFLEVDEDQHVSYSISCETSRMTRIVESLMLEGNSLPVLFVRYNPHAFRIDGVPQKVLKKDREKQLVEQFFSDGHLLFFSRYAMHIRAFSRAIAS